MLVTALHRKATGLITVGERDHSVRVKIQTRIQNDSLSGSWSPKVERLRDFDAFTIPY